MIGAARRGTVYVRCSSCPWHGRRVRGEDCSCKIEWGPQCRCAWGKCRKCGGDIAPASETRERSSA